MHNKYYLAVTTEWVKKNISEQKSQYSTGM